MTRLTSGDYWSIAARILVGLAIGVLAGLILSAVVIRAEHRIIAPLPAPSPTWTQPLTTSCWSEVVDGQTVMACVG